jgi:hypothetical protein
MLVHVWQTHRSNKGSQLIKCNCSAHFLGVPDNEHAIGLCGIDIGRVNQSGGNSNAATPAQYIPAQARYDYATCPPNTSYVTQPTYRTQSPLSPYMPAQPRYSYATCPPTTSYAIRPTYRPQSPLVPLVISQPPVYTASNSGMPVNIRDGAMLTEACGIFIQNLSYKVELDELKNLLCTVGQPIDCKVHKHRSGVSKGIATGKFASTHEAQLAVAHLNFKLHIGRTLKVHLDHDTTVIGQVGPPLIVNGSSGTFR